LHESMPQGLKAGILTAQNVRAEALTYRCSVAGKNCPGPRGFSVGAPAVGFAIEVSVGHPHLAGHTPYVFIRNLWRFVTAPMNWVRRFS